MPAGILTHISAREILDSRGNPTVEVSLSSEKTSVKCSVPSGASTGSHEAWELRDNDPDRYQGKGVLKAVNNITEVIAPALQGAKLHNQREIDETLLHLDGTKNKSLLGSNALLGVSIGYAKLSARHLDIPLYTYIEDHCYGGKQPDNQRVHIFANLINGGAHAPGGASIQEFQIIPLLPSVEQNIETIRSFQQSLYKELRSVTGGAVGVGDEGGFVISGYTSEQILDLLHQTKARLHLGKHVQFGLDIAAGEFITESGRYTVDQRELAPTAYEKFVESLLANYQIMAVEDPFGEDDFSAFSRLVKHHPDTLVIGDDLTVTNTARLQQAIANRSITGIIIKPNQIGTLSETLDVITLAHQHNIRCIASHRSGETNDDFIIDIARGTHCFGVKIGAPTRGERIAKYNRLTELSYA